MNLNKLQEIADKKGKKLFVENHSINVNKAQVEKPTLKEATISKDGGQFHCRAIIRDIPVSRYVENQNGRIYPKPLWQKIFTEKTAERTFCHSNHPEDDGDVLSYCGVWHNFKMGDETPTADLYLIGEAGELLLEAMLAGGKVHFSSVGYGEFEEDQLGVETNVVDSESFELVRLGDWVAESSQNVYATLENNDYQSEKSELKQESKEKDENFKKNITNKVRNDSMFSFFESELSDNKKEDFTNKEGAKIMDMKEKKFWENTTKSLLRDLRKEESLVVVHKDLSEHLETLPTEFTDLREKVTAEIDKVSAKLEENLSEKEAQLSETKQTKEQLESKLESATETLEDLKEKYKKATEVIETLQKSTLKESDKAISLYESNEKAMKSDLKKLLEDREIMSDDIEQFIEEVEKRDADLKAFTEDRELMQADIDQLLEDRENMKSDIVELLEQLEKATSDIKEMSKMKAMKKKKYEMDDEDEDEDEELEEMGGEYDYDDPMNYAATGSYFVTEEEEEDDEEAEDEDDDEEEMEERKRKMRSMRHRKESKSRRKPKSIKREKVQKRRPSSRKIVERKAKPALNDFKEEIVKDFFEKKVKEYGNKIEPLREHLYSFDSVVLADQAIDRYLEEADNKNIDKQFLESVEENFRNSEIFLNG